MTIIWGEPVRAVQPSRAQRLGIWLAIIVIFVGGAFLPGCDGEAAQVTAKNEEDAYERYLATMFIAIRSFPAANTPIRASTLEAKVTACQQLPDRKWKCEAQ